MLKIIENRFSLMHPTSFFILKLAMNLILLSSCMLVIYIDLATKSECFILISHHRETIKFYLSSLVLSFGGAFLLDYVSARA